MAEDSVFKKGACVVQPLDKAFRRELANWHWLMPAKTLIVAVSTGVDSMVLLSLLEQIAPQQRPQIVVAHVNHELRTASTTEEQFLRQYCQQHRLNLVVRHWPRADHPTQGVETAARQIRYDFFAELQSQYQPAAVLTAHHADDQAETFLMKLTRGGALPQLTGIAARQPFGNGELLRPLLPWGKATLRAYAEAHGITFFEDETNQSLTIQRNRLRHLVVPELKRENPQLLQHIASYQQQLQQLLSFQQQLFATYRRQIEVTPGHYDYHCWHLIPAVAQSTFLQELILKVTHQGTSQTVIAQLTHWLGQRPAAGTQFQLADGWRVLAHDTYFTIQKARLAAKKPRTDSENMVKLNQWFTLPNDCQGRVQLGKTPTSVWLTATEFPLHLRTWQTGDRLSLAHGQHQPVAKALKNAKVPLQWRVNWPVIVTAQNQVAWVPGVRAAWRPATADGEPYALELTDIRGLKGETEPNEQ